ncbi:MAG: hypothetical protein ABJM86_03095 [Hyphomicrobiales bacterium]
MIEAENKKEGWLSRTIRHPFTLSLYYFSIVGFAVVADRYSDLVSREAILFSAAAALILFVLVFSLTALSFRFVRAEEINDRVNDLKTFFAAQQMGWIVNDKYIRVMELGSPETWVFSRTLINDLDDTGEIFQSVKANLEENHKYTYFIPDTPTSYQAVSKYFKLHTFSKKQVQFYLIPEENFLFYTEIVAYNVHSESQSAIEWLPLTQESGNASQFYIKMDTSHSNYVVGIGEMYKQKYSPSSVGR